MQDIFERMQQIIADQFSVDPDEISTETSFEADLGADSVDLVELVMSMEEEPRHKGCCARQAGLSRSRRRDQTWNLWSGSCATRSMTGSC